MYSVHAIGYLICAASFAVLAASLATRWRDRMRGSLLLPAALTTVVWALVNVATGPAGSLLSLFVELAHQVAWLLFVAQALGGIVGPRLSPWLRTGPLALAATALAVGAWAALDGGTIGGVITLSRLVVVSGLLLGLAGFVLVEHVLRNTRGAHAWEVKFLWLGSGAIFAYDVTLFAASYALGGLSESLYAGRGYALALVAPVLAAGVRRITGFSPRVFMSQRFAFYTTGIVIAGAYLVTVAFLGVYVRAFGGTWGSALQILLVFAALLGLGATLLSRTFRARLAVGLAKHWFPYKYDYREEWLDLTERLTRDAEGSSLAQRTLEAFVHLGRVKSGALLMLRDDMLLPAAGALYTGGAPIAEPLDSPFCRFIVEREWIVKLERARAGVGQDAQVPLPAWLAAVEDGWLGVPLLHDKRLYGLVVLRQPWVRDRLTWEDLDLLRTAARQAGSYFALEYSADALARERQFAAVNRFTAFLMHDLSNIVAQQRLIVENAARHRANPEFVDDAIKTIENTVQRMGRLLEQLKSESAAAPAARRVELADVCRSALARVADREPRPRAGALAGEAAALLAPERLEQVLVHVIRNAQDATPAHGSVELSLRKDSTHAVIEVSDTGIGMDEQFVRDRLFRPFDTTKGAKGMGVGAFQAREFVRACGGDVKVQSAAGSGTRFVIRLPLVS